MPRCRPTEASTAGPRTPPTRPGLNKAIQYGRQLDPAEEVAWTAYQEPNCTGCPVTWMEIYYDDVETFGYKIDWALSKGLAGIGIFALGYDNGRPEFWKLLELKFGRPTPLVDNTAPTGSFELDPGDKLCSAPQVQLDFSLSDGQNGSGAVLHGGFEQFGDRWRRPAQCAPRVPGDESTGENQVSWAMDDPTTGGSLTTGTRRIYAQWRDVAGNWSLVSSTSFRLTLPGTAQLTVAGGASYTTANSVSVLVQQTGGRAITALKLSNSPALSGGVLANAVDATLGTTTSFSLINPATGGANVDGTHTVYAQWLDSAGCWSPPASAALILDRTPPAGSVSVVGAPAVAPTRNVQLLVPATDNASGVAQVALSNDGNTWTVLRYTGNPVNWSAATNQADGPWKIRARWQDAAGNWSATASTTIILDTHPPVGSITLNGGALATGADSVTVRDSASAAAGISQLVLANSPSVSGGVLANGVAFTPNGSVSWSLAGAGAPAPVGEGAHTVYAQWQDTFGRWSSVASATIVVDHTAPVVSVPIAGLPAGAQLGAGTVPVQVSWQATDGASGVAAASVERRTNGGGWQPLAQVPVKNGPHAAMSVVPGQATQVRVSATDYAGNASAFVAGDPFQATVFQDSNRSISYAGGWASRAVSSASGGTLRFAKAKGATATLSFSGRAVAWVAPRAHKRGKAKVFIDGSYVATIDLRGAATARQLVFSYGWTSVGSHTITLRVLHTRHRPRVDLDGLVVLA